MEMIRDFLTPEHVLLLCAGAMLLAMLCEYLRRKTNRRTAFLLGTGSGLSALLLVHFFGEAIGIVLPLTLCDLGISLVAGIPGVLVLIALRLLNL